MKKGTIVGFIAGVVLGSSVSGIAGTSYTWYKKLIKKEKVGIIREYYTEDVTENMRLSKDAIIVEKMIGKVTNKKKDGELLNGGYISYKSVKNARKGDIIETILIHAGGQEQLVRLDYIIDR